MLSSRSKLDAVIKSIIFKTVVLDQNDRKGEHLVELGVGKVYS